MGALAARHLHCWCVPQKVHTVLHPAALLLDQGRKAETTTICTTGVALREAVQQLQPDAQRGALMYEMSFGSVAGGSMAWDITHSTLPGRRGQHLLAEDVSLQDLRNLAASGSKLNAGKYCSDAGWDIIEASDPAQLGPAE